MRSDKLDEDLTSLGTGVFAPCGQTTCRDVCHYLLQLAAEIGRVILTLSSLAGVAPLALTIFRNAPPWQSLPALPSPRRAKAEQNGFWRRFDDVCTSAFTARRSTRPAPFESFYKLTSGSAPIRDIDTEAGRCLFA